jgi:hypothetical protein
MAMRIAVLEDNADRVRSMRACLADRFPMYELHFFGSARGMIEFLERHLSETLVVALDHDLELESAPNGSLVDPGTGRDVANFLAEQPPVCPIILHSTNTAAMAGMELVLKDAGWQTVRVVPFDDLSWIPTDWLRAMRRAIVGPVRTEPDAMPTAIRTTAT